MDAVRGWQHAAQDWAACAEYGNIGDLNDSFGANRASDFFQAIFGGMAVASIPARREGARQYSKRRPQDFNTGSRSPWKRLPRQPTAV